MNFKLFKNTFLQMAKIGISAAVLFILIVVMPVISTVSRISNYGTDYHEIISYSNEYMILVIFYMILAPLLALVGWNFQNKRNACDFYHALPYKRSTLFVSKLMAIIAWQTVIMLVTMVASFITYAIFSNYFVVDYVFAMKYYLGLWVCSMLCISAVTLGCMLTGTVINNILATGIILFFVRLMLLIFIILATDNIHVMISGRISPMLEGRYNMIFATIAQVFIGFNRGGMTSMYNNILCYLYTGGLAIIYFVLAGIVCTKRKSETAGKTALNNRISFIMKTIMVFFFFALGASILANGYLYEGCITGSDFTAMLTWYIIGIVFIAIYQIIVTKNAAMLKKLIMPIVVAGVLSAFYGWGIIATHNSIKNYSPDADEITSVSIYKEAGGYSSAIDYFESGVSRFECSDKTVIELVSTALKENVTINDKEFWTYIQKNKYVDFPVIIKDKTGNHYRNIYMTDKNAKKIVAIMGESEELKKFYLNLPNPSAKSIDVMMDSLDSPSVELANVLYEHLREYVKNMKFEDWYEMLNDYSAVGNNTIVVAFTENGQKYVMYLPIPEDEKLLADYYNFVGSGKAKENSKKIGQYLQKLLDKKADKTEFLNIGVDVYGSYYLTADELLESTEGKAMLEDIINTLLTERTYEKIDKVIPATIHLNTDENYCSVTIPLDEKYKKLYSDGKY